MAMAKLKLTDLKGYLKNKSQDDLVNEIAELTKQFPAVKEYYTVKLNPESENDAFEKYKKTVQNEFLPDRGFGKMRYSAVNKAISDYKKISNSPTKIAELMIYYAEIGVRFTNEFGDIDERFYGTIEKAYINALEYIFKNNLQKIFRDRADRIRISTNGIGWGFSDNMNDIFYNYYSGVEGD